MVRPYGQLGLARIADSVPDFVAAVEASLAEETADRVARADRLLSTMSWDRTWSAIRDLTWESVEPREESETETDALAG